MGVRQRPIGISALSCLAFLVSAATAIVIIRSVYQIALFLLGAPGSDTEDAAPPAYVLIPLALACLVTLGLIAL